MSSSIWMGLRWENEENIINYVSCCSLRTHETTTKNYINYAINILY